MPVLDAQKDREKKSPLLQRSESPGKEFPDVVLYVLQASRKAFLFIFPATTSREVGARLGS
jgi:hypothetical protein